MKNAKIDIRIFNTNISHTDKVWLYMRHPKEEMNYDFRWGIGYRKRDNWWGVICLFPATIEQSINEISYEMELAKEAIEILKKRRLLKYPLDK